MPDHDWDQERWERLIRDAVDRAFCDVPFDTTSGAIPAYQPAHADTLDTVIVMERAGLLTPQAAGLIARFSALSDRVVDCGWHSATQHGWVTYRGVTYTPAAFNALVASDMPVDMLGDASADAVEASPPLPDAPGIPDTLVNSTRMTWGVQVYAALELAAGVAIFAGALIVTAALVVWAGIVWLGQLAALLVSGLLGCLTGLLGR